MTLVRHRSALPVLASLALLVFTACKLEEDLELRNDGSGRYQAQFTADTADSAALDEIEQKARAAGMRIVERGSSGNRAYIIVSRRFESVKELQVERMQFNWRVRETGGLRKTFSATLDVPRFPLTAYQRIVQVKMPGSIISSGAGKAAGSTVTWDASKGGRLTVVSSGIVLPLGQRELIGVGAVIVVGLLVLFLAHRRAKLKALRRCDACGAVMPDDVLYCHNCGSGSGLPEQRAVAS
jgi:hypothetical protein